MGGVGSGSEGEEVTTFTFDAEGNLRSTVDAEANTYLQEYDRVYNLTATEDANGNRTTLDYDALNRLIRSTDADGNVLDAEGL